MDGNAYKKRTIKGLVLQRLDGEQINIGNDIVIEIVKAKKGRAWVQIQAPRETKILRAELETNENQ